MNSKQSNTKNQSKNKKTIDLNQNIKIEKDPYLEVLQSKFHHDAFRPE